MKKDVIYQTEIRDYTSDEVRREYAEFNEIEPENIDKITSDELYEFVMEENRLCYEDSMRDLDINLSGRIIVIAKLGLWNGTRSAYKFLSNNMKSVLTCACGDEYELYCDARDMRAVDSHHDGTNYYLFREVKPEIGEKALDNFLNKIYNGNFDQKDITRYTRSIRKPIAELYGW